MLGCWDLRFKVLKMEEDDKSSSKHSCNDALVTNLVNQFFKLGFCVFQCLFRRLLTQLGLV